MEKPTVLFGEAERIVAETKAPLILRATYKNGRSIRATNYKATLHLKKSQNVVPHNKQLLK